jgi:hypothetical protein
MILSTLTVFVLTLGSWTSDLEVISCLRSKSAQEVGRTGDAASLRLVASVVGTISPNC